MTSLYTSIKNDINLKRMFLSRPNRLNPMNKRPIFLRKRLTKEDLKVNISGDKTKNMVTTTFNSRVKVFVETPENKTVAKVVRTGKDDDNLENAAVCKKQKLCKEKVTAENYEETSKRAKHWNKWPLELSPTIMTPNAKQVVTSGTPTDNNFLGMWAKK